VRSADEKTVDPGSLPPARAMRVEHEYERGETLQYLAAWDWHQAKLFGRCEPRPGILPFDRRVEQVMTTPAYARAHRVFWIADNGASHRGARATGRLQDRFRNLR